MSRYSPSGVGAKMLERLDRGAAWARDLAEAATANPKRRKKMWRPLQALRLDGLVRHNADGLIEITEAGRQALLCLRSGHEVEINNPAPSVRIFREAA